jgi:outer membrane protein assembly factor BamE (lipoprotein component of BamABCDE complex)
MSRLLFCFFLFFLTGCAKTSLMQSGSEAEYNQYYIGKLRMGMTEDEVWDMMGRPYKTESRPVKGNMYDVWYYVTKGKILGQTKILSRNLTPLVFKDKILKGWGRRYYKYLLDIDDARERAESREHQKYTNDKDEWPPEEHGYVPSPYEKDKAEKKQQEESAQDPTPKPKETPPPKNPYERTNKHSIWDKDSKTPQ